MRRWRLTRHLRATQRWPVMPDLQAKLRLRPMRRCWHVPRSTWSALALNMRQAPVHQAAQAPFDGQYFGLDSISYSVLSLLAPFGRHWEPPVSSIDTNILLKTNVSELSEWVVRSIGPILRQNSRIPSLEGVSVPPTRPSGAERQRRSPVRFVRDARYMKGNV